MEKPILSPNFTIEDIHKLREYNYEMTKHMTDKERMDYYNARSFRGDIVQDVKRAEPGPSDLMIFWKDGSSFLAAAGGKRV